MSENGDRSLRDASKSREDALVLRSVSDGVATLTLNSPTNLNALSSAMIDALQAALDELRALRDVRVIVLAANGKAFCAGHDLREMRSHEDEAWHRALFDRCSQMMMTIESLPQPVIASVQGLATAAGCQLVATCDIAVASQNAHFATSGINLGLFCSTPAVPLLRSVPAKRAAEMLFTGEFIDAKTAFEIGLVNRVVAAEALTRATLALAAPIASQSSAALASGKRLLRELRGTSSANAYALAARNMACDMQSRDARAGIDAFLAKAPKPQWTHEGNDN